jgi:hypothetical protein
MPIATLSLRDTMYVVQNFSGFGVAPVAKHYLFDWNNVRVNLNNIAPQGEVHVIAPQNDPAGDTVYLSYFPNEIASVMLPEPPPAGITTFLTDSLDGCTIIVDTITAGGQGVVVYHANAREDGLAPNIAMSNPGLQTNAATARMSGLHAAAQQDYQTRRNLTVQYAVTLAKSDYFGSPELEVRRKVRQHRQNVGFDGGALVIGLASGGRWEFYYQAWGYIEYDRPWFAPKGWKHGKHVKRGDQVYASGRFYP